MKLWHRSVGSPINGFLNGVRYFAEGAAEGASGEGAGAAGGGSGEGQGEGQGAGQAGQGDAGQGGQGSQAADWRSGIDVSIKDHPSLKDFKTPADLAKSWVEAQKLIGVEKLPMPPKDAKPEVREQFLNTVYDRLGRPKEAKEYKITDIKLPEGVNFKIDPAGIDALKVEAHKLGLLPHQLDGLYKWYMMDTINKVKSYNDNATKEKQDSEASLRSELGMAYDGKLAKAQGMLNKFAGNDYKALLDSGFGNHPAVIRFMAKMADAISEDTFTKGGSESTMTPKEAERELSKIRQQLVDMPQSNPEYKDLLKRRNDLMQMATPG